MPSSTSPRSIAALVGSFLLLILALVLPAGAWQKPKSTDGQRLFEAKCSPCHGIKGQGVLRFLDRWWERFPPTSWRRLSNARCRRGRRSVRRRMPTRFPLTSTTPFTPRGAGAQPAASGRACPVDRAAIPKLGSRPHQRISLYGPVHGPAWVARRVTSRADLATASSGPSTVSTPKSTSTSEPRRQRLRTSTQTTSRSPGQEAFLPRHRRVRVQHPLPPFDFPMAEQQPLPDRRWRSAVGGRRGSERLGVPVGR